MLSTPKSLRGAVTAPHHLASQAGLDILKDGGNAVEAAVAMAATLAVVYPHMNSIGGDSFWLISTADGRVNAVHGCGRAAAAATIDRYTAENCDAVPWRGSLAANTVAGTVSGWAGALNVCPGKLPLSALLADAIGHARRGVPITGGGAALAAAKDADLAPLSGYGAVFRPDGSPLGEGEVLHQPALGATLDALASSGLDDFYRGDVARAMAQDLEAAGTLLTLDDLITHEAGFPVPLRAATVDGTLYNTGAPTQGVVSLLILALSERLGAREAESAASIHSLVEATKAAVRAHRRLGIGDPDHAQGDPQALLDDPGALDGLAREIDGSRAAPWPHPGEDGDTVWFGVADGAGNVVSAIQSTYHEFGSGIVLPQTGVLWQNRGASFSLDPRAPNALAPRRLPFHTLNPAIAHLADGRRFAYGSMGGEGQPQTQAAIFTRYVRQEQPLQAAITAPRWLLGRTWGEDSTTLKLEDRFDSAIIEDLRAAGHDVEVVPSFTALMGHAGGVVRHPSGLIEAASDPRSDGSVAAW